MLGGQVEGKFGNSRRADGGGKVGPAGAFGLKVIAGGHIGGKQVQLLLPLLPSELRLKKLGQRKAYNLSRAGLRPDPCVGRLFLMAGGFWGEGGGERRGLGLARA